MLPTTSQLLARLKNSDRLPSNSLSGGDSGFDALVQAIALQLLASCYTFIPVSSANHLPLFQTKTSTKLVTALQAHAPYRLSPAAGHHARASSENYEHPDLRKEPSNGDELAGTVGQRRQSARCSNGYIPKFAASGWTDGPTDPDQQLQHASSSAPFKCDLLVRLNCQLSNSGNPRRKHDSLLSTLCCESRKEHSSSAIPPTPTQSSQQVATQAVQRISSAIRPRNAQPDPRMQEERYPHHPTFGSRTRLIRRTNPSGSVGSEHRIFVDASELRRVSATSSTSHIAQPSLMSVGEMSGGDIISAREYVDEKRAGERPSIGSGNRLPPVSSCTAGPSPFSAPETQADESTQQEANDACFNMPKPALLQGDWEGGRHDMDVQFSSPNYNDRQAANTHPLIFDTNGQTETDRQLDREYGTETGHNSQQVPVTATQNGDYNAATSNLNLEPHERDHNHLARDDSSMCEDNVPNSNPDPRLKALKARQDDRDGEEEPNTDDLGNRRLKRIQNYAGVLDCELTMKAEPVINVTEIKNFTKMLEADMD